MYIHDKSFVVKLSTFRFKMGNYGSIQIYLINPIQMHTFAYGKIESQIIWVNIAGCYQYTPYLIWMNAIKFCY